MDFVRNGQCGGNRTCHATEIVFYFPSFDIARECGYGRAFDAAREIIHHRIARFACKKAHLIHRVAILHAGFYVECFVESFGKIAAWVRYRL
jgi:hypothetical protein